MPSPARVASGSKGNEVKRGHLEQWTFWLSYAEGNRNRKAMVDWYCDGVEGEGRWEVVGILERTCQNPSEMSVLVLPLTWRLGLQVCFFIIEKGFLSLLRSHFIPKCLYKDEMSFPALKVFICVMVPLCSKEMNWASAYPGCGLKG